MNNNHWCLAAIDIKNKIITYYDSLGGSNNKALNVCFEITWLIVRTSSSTFKMSIRRGRGSPWIVAGICRQPETYPIKTTVVTVECLH